MAYIMVEASVRTHRKFLAAGPAASWLWLCGLGYCQDGLTDGFIPRSAIDFLGVKGAAKLAPKLVSVGLWHEDRDGWTMHDYLDHNRSAADIRVVMRKRGDGGKLGGRPRKTIEVIHGKPSEKPSIPEDGNLTENPLLSSPTDLALPSDRDGRDRAPTTDAVGVWRKPEDAAHGAGTRTGLVNGTAIRRHAGHAWCSDREGLCVPEFLHAEFLGKSGKSPADLFAWYRSALALYAGRAIGEDALIFWRNCFAQWVGTATSRPSGAVTTKGEQTKSAMQRVVEKREAERQAGR